MTLCLLRHILNDVSALLYVSLKNAWCSWSCLHVIIAGLNSCWVCVIKSQFTREFKYELVLFDLYVSIWSLYERMLCSKIPIMYLELWMPVVLIHTSVHLPCMLMLLIYWIIFEQFQNHRCPFYLYSLNS